MLLFLYRVHKILNEISRQFELRKNELANLAEFRNIDFVKDINSTKYYLNNLNDTFPLSNRQKRDWFHELNGIKKTLRRQKYSVNSVKTALTYFQLTAYYLSNLLLCFQSENVAIQSLQKIIGKKHNLRMSTRFEEEEIEKAKERLGSLKMPDKNQVENSRKFKTICEKRLQDFEKTEGYFKVLFLIPPILNLIMLKYNFFEEDKTILEKLYIALSSKNYEKISEVNQTDIDFLRATAKTLNSKMLIFEQNRWKSKDNKKLGEEVRQAILDINNACNSLLLDINRLSRNNSNQRLAA